MRKQPKINDKLQNKIDNFYARIDKRSRTKRKCL